MRHHASYSIVGSFPDRLIIRDDWPETHEGPTITNDAEWVVADILKDQPKVLAGRVLLYIDSEGRMDQLLVKNGRFAGFALAPR